MLFSLLFPRKVLYIQLLSISFQTKPGRGFCNALLNLTSFILNKHPHSHKKRNKKQQSPKYTTKPTAMTRIKRWFIDPSINNPHSRLLPVTPFSQTIPGFHTFYNGTPFARCLKKPIKPLFSTSDHQVPPISRTPAAPVPLCGVDQSAPGTIPLEDGCNRAHFDLCNWWIMKNMMMINVGLVVSMAHQLLANIWWDSGRHNLFVIFERGCHCVRKWRRLRVVASLCLENTAWWDFRGNVGFWRGKSRRMTAEINFRMTDVSCQFYKSRLNNCE